MDKPPSKGELQAQVDAEAKKLEAIGEQVADVRNNLQTIRFHVDEIREEDEGTPQQPPEK